MTHVVPFMNGKGGSGKSTLARTFAVEVARAGATVLLADLDDEQKTTALWAENRRRNGWLPEIRVEVVSPRKAYELVGQTDVLVIDAPPRADARMLFLARWATFTVLPCRANRSDDLAETVRLLHKLSAEGIPAWRYGVALNGLRAATAERDNRDARACLKEAGYPALAGFTRDLKTYEVAMLEGRAMTETDRPNLNGEAYRLAENITKCTLDAGRRLKRQMKARKLEAERIREQGGTAAA